MPSNLAAVSGLLYFSCWNSTDIAGSSHIRRVAYNALHWTVGCSSV